MFVSSPAGNPPGLGCQAWRQQRWKHRVCLNKTSITTEFTERANSADDENNDDDDDDGQEEETWVLEMLTVAGQDSGVYTCRVHTQLDDATDDLILTVQGQLSPQFAMTAYGKETCQFCSSYLSNIFCLLTSFHSPL